MTFAPRTWLICYDIADPKRLNKVHRTVSQHAMPVQYSVFHLHATPAQIEELLATLRHIIDPQQDDIRVYPLPRQPEFVTMGRTPWSRGNLLIGNEIPDFGGQH